MISKELLSEVLGIEIFNFKITGGVVKFNDEGDYTACPECFHPIKPTSACSRYWSCSNVDCNESGDFEFTPPQYNVENCDYINIYELAHKCKEWARNKNIALDVEMNPNGYKVIISDLWGEIWKKVRPTFEGDSEPEVIFKVCQWILENKDKR